MKKRRKKVRLYRKIDSDLITLYRHPNFSLRGAIIRSLQMCAAGEVKYIRLPEPYILNDIPEEIEFTIDLPDDPLLDSWFHSIPKGTRNDAVKNIVRGYLCGPVISSYARNTEKDNIAGFNSNEKQMISCCKTKNEVIKDKEVEMKRLRKILRQDGISAETMLALLEKEKHSEQEKAVQAVSEDIPKTADDGPADAADDIRETNVPEETAWETDNSFSGTEDLMDTPPAAEEPGVEEDGEEDGDFDLFGAVNSMMDDL